MICAVESPSYHSTNKQELKKKKSTQQKLKAPWQKKGNCNLGLTASRISVVTLFPASSELD